MNTHEESETNMKPSSHEIKEVSLKEEVPSNKLYNLRTCMNVKYDNQDVNIPLSENSTEFRKENLFTDNSLSNPVCSLALRSKKKLCNTAKKTSERKQVDDKVKKIKNTHEAEMNKESNSQEIKNIKRLPLGKKLPLSKLPNSKSCMNIEKEKQDVNIFPFEITTTESKKGNFSIDDRLYIPICDLALQRNNKLYKEAKKALEFSVKEHKEENFNSPHEEAEINKKSNSYEKKKRKSVLLETCDESKADSEDNKPVSFRLYIPICDLALQRNNKLYKEAKKAMEFSVKEHKEENFNSPHEEAEMNKKSFSNEMKKRKRVLLETCEESKADSEDDKPVSFSLKNLSSVLSKWKKVKVQVTNLSEVALYQDLLKETEAEVQGKRKKDLSKTQSESEIDSEGDKSDLSETDSRRASRFNLRRRSVSPVSRQSKRLSGKIMNLSEDAIYQKSLKEAGAEMPEDEDLSVKESEPEVDDEYDEFTIYSSDDDESDVTETDDEEMVSISEEKDLSLRRSKRMKGINKNLSEDALYQKSLKEADAEMSEEEYKPPKRRLARRNERAKIKQRYKREKWKTKKSWNKNVRKWDRRNKSAKVEQKSEYEKLVEKNKAEKLAFLENLKLNEVKEDLVQDVETLIEKQKPSVKREQTYQNHKVNQNKE